MRRIILDTNFLLIPEQFRVDVFSEFHRILDFPFALCIPDCSVAELNEIARGAGKHGRAASVALMLIRRNRIEIVPARSQGHADDAIVELAAQDDIVATQDAVLKRRLREKGIAVITLRKGSHLILV